MESPRFSVARAVLCLRLRRSDESYGIPACSRYFSRAGSFVRTHTDTHTHFPPFPSLLRAFPSYPTCFVPRLHHLFIVSFHLFFLPPPPPPRMLRYRRTSPSPLPSSPPPSCHGIVEECSYQFSELVLVIDSRTVQPVRWAEQDTGFDSCHLSPGRPNHTHAFSPLALRSRYVTHVLAGLTHP